MNGQELEVRKSQGGQRGQGENMHEFVLLPNLSSIPSLAPHSSLLDRLTRSID